MNQVPGVSSTRESVPFAKLRREKIIVNLVMVQPNGKGKAFGHTQSGQCVTFTSGTQEMIALFHKLRASGREIKPSAVVVNGAEWTDIHSIDDSECPIHSLPEIPNGSAVAFAPY